MPLHNNRWGQRDGKGRRSEIGGSLCGKNPIRKILDAVQSFGGNAEAQDDRTLVVLERIK